MYNIYEQLFIYRGDDMIYELSEFFKVLSDQTRLKILLALSEKECNVTELQKITNSTQSTVSHQLRILRQTNLVRYKKIGRNVYYRLYDEHIVVIIKYAIEHIQEFGGSKNA
ncbi:ArsR family transcriptional regulator [Thermosipho affectus]|uniref:ArsR family transcriptional regulator n=2 Tax=Fervidobacteriaceae TaxID=1643950 RepID=A0ABX3IHF6_9BACT|nr:ArsR family transcriptional regulator [Thermosipho sp. 1063]MBT1247585.1 ArsR family transcriptional regulator [Thermosipho sp. 1244]ONN26619.1 ArsR family transcriptional regulator [Thermosipho affectus]OOC42015.1 ArsR family transcriptional regulator [Thermosipho sp. 1074]OOC46178.1 ArsR family transcriptional regulator [Thermosipho sp. 1223]